MKKVYKYIISGIIPFAIMSCSSWFNINPKTDLKAELLFENESGFYSALNGAYQLMLGGSSYGGDFNFGLMDQLAQIYSSLPDGVDPNSRAAIYAYTIDNIYQSKSRLKDIWLENYKVIANINNLFSWLYKKGEEVIKGKNTLNMFYGELYAMRAYIHFDLLRSWGPIYAQDSTSLSIPYRTKADMSKQPRLKAKDVIKLIKEDLFKARNYLQFEANKSLDEDLNIDRRFRLNYHAVSALLARVYAYTLDKENAVKYAEEAINASGLTLKIGNADDPILFAETIFGLNMDKMDERLKIYFTEKGSKPYRDQYYTSLPVYKQLFNIAGTESEDMRARSSAFYIYKDDQQVMSKKYIKNDNMVVPLIRLPEMYYILCEMKPLEQGAFYINEVRHARGYSESSDLNFTSDQDRIDALNAEYRKEFYAEGKYFYFLKSHKIETLINGASQMGEAQYIFPLPDAEEEYGWAEEAEGKDN